MYIYVIQHYLWPKIYKWLIIYVHTCKACQRIKPLSHSAALVTSYSYSLVVGSPSVLTFCFSPQTPMHALWYLLTVWARWITKRLCWNPSMVKIQLYCLSIVCFVNTSFRWQFLSNAIPASQESFRLSFQGARHRLDMYTARNFTDQWSTVIYMRHRIYSSHCLSWLDEGLELGAPWFLCCF